MGVCLLEPDLCIVTEFMEGGSVANIIHKQRRTLGLNLVLKWVSNGNQFKVAQSISLILIPAIAELRMLTG